MDWGPTPSMLGAAIELAALDLLLGADNAMLIALACRPLPPALRKRALLVGLIGAIALRFGLLLLASALLSIPALRLAAAVLLVWIAARLLSDSQKMTAKRMVGNKALAYEPRKFRFWGSVLIVIATDAVMSLDNIVALVSVSQGDATLLILGLLMSIPALMYGSFVLTKMFDEWPILVLCGTVLLGWIAGQMAASDVLVATWISRDAPALSVALPVLCACYVYILSQSPGGETRSALSRDATKED